MKKALLTIAFFALLVAVSPDLRSLKTVPGLQQVGGSERVHNCSKGKHYDYRQGMCVR